jgi:hypothetical protein
VPQSELGLDAAVEVSRDVDDVDDVDDSLELPLDSLDDSLDGEDFSSFGFPPPDFPRLSVL